jgi:hypothetical protein
MLNGVRLVQVANIENPSFYSQLAEQGLSIPLDFSVMSGITYGDTILVARRAPLAGAAWYSVLFHELVHVTQYEVLGIDRFIEEYVAGWAASGFVYESIPLERDAYELGAVFDGRPTSVFDVRMEVLSRLGARNVAS